jgi:hypothetical protein
MKIGNSGNHEMSSSKILEKLAIYALMALTVPAIAGDQPEDVASWVRDSYAPLWQEQPWNKLEDILRHYDNQVTVYAAEGEIEVKNAREWLGSALAAWRDEGWIDSHMTALQTHPINESTAAFIMQWNDRYKDSADEISCGWYLANRIDGHWKFTAYADSVCPER